MSKWKNYRDEKKEEKKEQDLLSDHEKEIALANEHTRQENELAAMDAARNAAFSSQKAEIDAAASLARSHGHSTDGKIVGMQSISPTAGGDGACRISVSRKRSKRMSWIRTNRLPVMRRLPTLPMGAGTPKRFRKRNGNSRAGGTGRRP